MDLTDIQALKAYIQNQTTSIGKQQMHGSEYKKIILEQRLWL